MTAVPYAPRLLEPGSDFVVSENILNIYSRESWTTDKAQLVPYAGDTIRKLISGPMKLVSDNLRNLSQVLTDRGVRVKAWSFHSGVLPGAEMMYVGSGELDDLLTITEAPSFAGELTKRFNELHEAGLLNKDERGRRTANHEQVYRAGLSEAYIVDDWSLFKNEMDARWRAAGRQNVPYAEADSAAVDTFGLTLGLFAANVSPDSELGLVSGEQTKVEHYEGYRRTALTEAGLLYDYSDYKMQLAVANAHEARKARNRVMAKNAKDLRKNGKLVTYSTVRSQSIEEA